jgi:hypothetical protein
MIISVEELKQHINTSETDSVLEGKLQALELLIRKYTNNNFQKQAFRIFGDIADNAITPASALFKQGDTIQISQSDFNEGLYVVKDVNNTITVEGILIDEPNILVTKVEYPMDVKMGVINMIKWDIENRAKVGIQSETISRHSVTYFNMDGDNSSLGYPKSLVGFLKPYRKSR